MLSKFVFANALFAFAVLAPAADKDLQIPNDDFQRLLAVIKPRKGESPWREIAWLTNVTEARKRAAAEGKPIVIFTAADGSPLGRT